MKKWIWLLIALSPALLFVNCDLHGNQHSSHDGRSASSKHPDDSKSDDKNGEQADDDDQSLVHTFSRQSVKVELNPALLSEAPVSSLNPQQVFAKANHEGFTTVVPRALDLMVLVDNDCIHQAREERLKTSEKLNASETPLSEKAFRESQHEPIESLKYQAIGFQAFEEIAVDQLIAEADADTCVLHVANNYSVRLPPVRMSALISAPPNDPGYELQLHLPSIRAPQGWSTLLSPGRGVSRDVIVAVVDSGIDTSHRDLAANIWRGGAGKGGIDLFSNTADPMDDSGHGTHVAGLIGAVSDNRLGVAGVMRSRAKLMGVKVFGSDGSGSVATVVNGIRWAADNGADVINLSMELEGIATSVRDALTYATSKGAVVIIAAGNQGRALSNSYFVSPASFAPEFPGTLAVASTDAVTGRLSAFSNYSSNVTRIAAPGSEDSAAKVGLLSTVPGNNYRRLEGTSMAAPLVTGAAALIVGIMKSDGHQVNPAEVVQMIRSSARANSDLLTSVDNGATLDLEKLGKKMKWRYMIDGDGGTESPF